MYSIRKILVSLLFVCLPFQVLAAATTSGITTQCQANGINYQDANMFVATLQKAITKNDKRTIADNIAYPLRINKMGKTSYIKNKNEFLEKYTTIFTADINKSILASKPASVFCNYQGAMIANGKVWFHGKPLKIFSMNVNK